MKRLILKSTVAMLAVVLFSATAFAGIPDSGTPARLVNDFAGVLNNADSLETALVAFDDTTSNQICVVTIDDLEGKEVNDYALELGRKWGIGSSKNNGVLVLLTSRKVTGYIDFTIQVGYGLEGAIPDIYASRIINNIMAPYLREDNYSAAVAAACDQLMKLASGEISEPRDSLNKENDDPLEIWSLVIVIVAVVAVFVYVSKKAKNNKGNGNNHHRGSSSGGVPPIFFGGGGSSSGGGHFGGFGGFGGGSFGGGGASGRV